MDSRKHRGALALVTLSYREARTADQYGWPKLIGDAYCAHLVAITAALEAGHSGAEVDAARGRA